MYALFIVKLYLISCVSFRDHLNLLMSQWVKKSVWQCLSL